MSGIIIISKHQTFFNVCRHSETKILSGLVSHQSSYYLEMGYANVIVLCTKNKYNNRRSIVMSVCTLLGYAWLSTTKKKKKGGRKRKRVKVV